MFLTQILTDGKAVKIRAQQKYQDRCAVLIQKSEPKPAQQFSRKRDDFSKREKNNRTKLIQESNASKLVLMP